MTETQAKRFNHMRHRWLGAVARDKKLPGSAQRVAILIWEYTNVEYGYAWPSLEHIAEELQMDRSTAIRAIKKLEARSWITVRRQSGRYRVNQYRLAFGRSSEERDGPGEEEWQDRNETVVPLHRNSGSTATR